MHIRRLKNAATNGNQRVAFCKTKKNKKTKKQRVWLNERLDVALEIVGVLDADRL